MFYPQDCWTSEVSDLRWNILFQCQVSTFIILYCLIIKKASGFIYFNVRLVFSAESVTLNDCLQLSYMPSKRNHMLLLYPREILILDLEVNQTVGIVAIERTGAPFLQVNILQRHWPFLTWHIVYIVEYLNGAIVALVHLWHYYWSWN